MTTVVLNTVTRKVEVFSSARDVQARAEIADHKAAADPHPQYLADADLAEVALSGDAGDLTAGTVPDARMPSWAGYNLASRAALEAANVPAAVDGLRLLGHATPGDGGGAHYKRVASEPAHPHKIQSVDGAWWEELFAVDVTVNIPSDFATLQDAIDRLSKQPVRQGARIILNIESGHALTAGVLVIDGNYGNFHIESSDATVPLVAGWPDDMDIIAGVRATMPVLRCVIDAGNKGRMGYAASDGSRGRIWSTGGIINMGIPMTDPGSTGSHGTALQAFHGSVVNASGAKLTGAAQNAIRISRGSILIGDFVNASDAARTALFVSRGSIVHANGANFSNAGKAAVRVARSLVSVRQGDMSGAAEDGINAFEGAVVAARFGDLSNCGNYGVNAFQGGAIVDADECTITGAGIDGVLASAGSKVNVEGATITGSGGTDLVIAGGSSIHANGATYGTASHRENALTAAGTIFNSAEISFPHRVSNANGEYVRFADGTLICTRHVQHDLNAGIQSWSFPAVFIERPCASFAVVGNTAADLEDWYTRNGMAWAFSPSEWRTRAHTGEGIDKTVEVQLTAIGRWY